MKLIDVRQLSVVSTFSDERLRIGMNWSRSCISPDSSFVASGSADGNLFVWNTMNEKLETILKGHK